MNLSCQIINDDEYRKSLIEKGQENIRRFDTKTVARQYVELYQKVISS